MTSIIRLLEMANKILCYDFKIRFKVGREHQVVDALSRHPNLSNIQVIHISCLELIDLQVIMEENL